VNPGNPNAKQGVGLQFLLIEIAKSHLQHTLDKFRIGHESEGAAHPAIMDRARAGEGTSLGVNDRIHVRTFALQIRKREAQECT
jgi:hypothetical protein